jgi:hypothetical protein
MKSYMPKTIGGYRALPFIFYTVEGFEKVLVYISHACQPPKSRWYKLIQFQINRQEMLFRL